MNQIKLKRRSGKKKIYVCKCNFDQLVVKYADANTRYADLLKIEEFEVSPAIVMHLPLQFTKCLDTKNSCTELPQEFNDDMKTEVECYRNEEFIAMTLYSSPASSPPIFHFLRREAKMAKPFPHIMVHMNMLNKTFHTNSRFSIMLLKCSMLDLQV